jgi:hypothetical protein
MKKLQAKLKFDYKRLGTVSKAKQLSWLTAYLEIFEPGRNDMSAEASGLLVYNKGFDRVRMAAYEKHFKRIK